MLLSIHARRVSGLSLFILLAMLVFAVQARAQSSQIVTCSSDDMHRRVCEVGPNRGIRMVKQRSDARCDYNRTFGFGGTQIWVDRGCRADFEVLTVGGGPGNSDFGRDHRPDRDDDHNRDRDRDRDHDRDGYQGNGATQVVTCSSDNMRRNFCNVGPNRGIRMVKQRSDARCDYGRTFGFSGSQIWVDRGCRADFEVIGGGGGYWGRGGYGGQSSTQVITCSSDDMGLHYCAVNGTPRSIQLIKQHSDSPCARNSTYGIRGNQVWVDRGCRADFSVTVR